MTQDTEAVRFDPEPWDIRRASMKRAEDGGWVRYDDYLALAAERDALRDAAEFLLERLHEWSSDNLTDENCGDWFGHVDPSMERLSALTGEAKP